MAEGKKTPAFIQLRVYQGKVNTLRVAIALIKAKAGVDIMDRLAERVASMTTEETEKTVYDLAKRLKMSPVTVRNHLGRIESGAAKEVVWR